MVYIRSDKKPPIRTDKRAFHPRFYWAGLDFNGRGLAREFSPLHKIEDGMPLHRRLASVVHGLRRRQLLTHEVLRVPADRLHPHADNVGAVGIGQLEPTSELAPGKTRKGLGFRHLRVTLSDTGDQAP